MRKVVDIADVAVGFSSSDRERGAIIDAATEMMATTDASPDVDIAFRSRSIARPDRPWDHADGDIRLWWSDDEVVIGHGSVTALVQDETATIGGRRDLPRAFRQLLPYVLTHLMAPAGRFLLHAGAVVLGDRVTLILGPSGSGKSSLTVAGIGAGWEPLGDDLVAVRLHDSVPEIRGIARPVLAPGPALQMHAVGGAPLANDPRHRWLVDQATDSTTWHPLTGTVITRWREDAVGAPAEHRALDSHELIEWLVFSFLASRDERRLRAYLPVAAAVTRVGGSQVRHGLEATGLPALLDRPPSAGTIDQLV